MKLQCLVVASVIALIAADLPNLVQLANNNNATTLVQLLEQAGLTDVIADQGPFTLIVPTNDAFSKVDPADLQQITSDPQTLSTTLQYHVIKGEVFTFDLRSGEVFTSLNGHSIRVYVSGNNIFFNQAKVVISDVLQASNGVIYLVNEPLNVPEGTIDAILMKPEYNISMFLDLIKAAHLENVFNRTSGQRYTVFAPTNDAIMSLDSAVLQKIKAIPSYARQIVDYHVHQGTLHEGSLDHNGRVTTMLPGHYVSIVVDTDGTVKLNNVATLEETDIEAEDGVVHVISHVLLPSSLASIVG